MPSTNYYKLGKFQSDWLQDSHPLHTTNTKICSLLIILKQKLAQSVKLMMSLLFKCAHCRVRASLVPSMCPNSHRGKCSKYSWPYCHDARPFIQLFKSTHSISIPIPLNTTATATAGPGEEGQKRAPKASACNSRGQFLSLKTLPK